MPEFILDTSGRVYSGQDGDYNPSIGWRNLDDFTRGYIEALFFTEVDYGGNDESFDPANGSALPHDAGFADLAPKTLAAIIADCAKFQATPAYLALAEAPDEILDALPGGYAEYDQYAGHDFWMTRCGHGVGFWDGDWPGPYATALNEACKAFGSVDVYLGDDGKVYFG